MVGSCYIQVLYHGQQDLFHIEDEDLEDVSPLKASSALNNLRGVASFESVCGSFLTEVLRTCEL